MASPTGNLLFLQTADQAVFDQALCEQAETCQQPISRLLYLWPRFPPGLVAVLAPGLLLWYPVSARRPEMSGLQEQEQERKVLLPVYLPGKRDLVGSIALSVSAPG